MLNTISSFLRASGKKYSYFLKATFSVAIIVYCVFKIGVSNVVETFLSLHPFYAVLGVLFAFLNIFLQYLKWRNIMKGILGVDDKRRTFYSLLQGIAAALLTPMRVGEFLGRKIRFPEKSVTEITAGTLIDKYFNLFIYVTTGSLGAILFLYYKLHVFYLSIVLMFLAMIVLFFLVSLVFSRRVFEKIKNATLVKRYSRVSSILNRAEPVLLTARQVMPTQLVLSFFIYAATIIQFSLFAKAADPTGRTGDFLWIAMLTYFTKTMMPVISLGELGVREFASMYFMKTFHYDMATGFNASILMFITNLALPALFSSILFLRKES